MESNLRTDMKIPSRPAPPLPGQTSNRRNPRTSAAVDLMSLENDSFSQSINMKLGGKKKPPPRPPPPKAKAGSQNKASGSLFDIFGRSKEAPRGKAAATAIVKPMPPVSGTQVSIDSLIDLYSPSSSPTFSKSSSSGIIHFNNYSKSNHIESGFEDDFDSLVASNSTTPSYDPFSDSADPFSPISKVSGSNFAFELSNEDPKAKRYAPVNNIVSNFSKPTIIRPKAKPARPPPPKSVVGGSSGGGGMSNSMFASEICTPVKISENISDQTPNWSSPPMPTVPPPPPPPEIVQVLMNGPPIPPRPSMQTKAKKPSKTPYCIAEYDYEGTHVDDLPFKTGDVITLIAEVNSDWLKGKLSGNEGMFPRNYVNIVVPLGQEEDSTLNMTAIALYSFNAETWDDLDFQEGEEIKVLRRVNEDWLYGECNGRKGQFPENYVQDITTLVSDES